MTFRPINPRNAVLEAVVGLHFDRPISVPETEAVRALHRELSADLPRLEPPVPTFAFGPAPPVTSPGAPVAMTAFQKNGMLEARLLLQGALLAANFLLYTRWDELWPKALRWVRAVIDAAQEAGRTTGLPPLRVRLLAHQMINAFIWTGDIHSVTVRQLFREKPSRMADAAWDAVGRPWFAAHSERDAAGAGDVLVDAVSFDLGEEPGVGWRLRLEHTMELRFGAPTGPADLLAELPTGGATKLETLFGPMHNRTRALMRSLLLPDMLVRIGMDRQ